MKAHFSNFEHQKIEIHVVIVLLDSMRVYKVVTGIEAFFFYIILKWTGSWAVWSLQYVFSRNIVEMY